MFTSTLRWRSLKTQQSSVILDLCLTKTRSEKSHEYRDATVFKKFHFPNVFLPQGNAKPAFSNSSGLKSVLEKLRFRDGLVWTVGLTGVVCTGLIWLKFRLMHAVAFLFPSLFYNTDVNFKIR